MTSRAVPNRIRRWRRPLYAASFTVIVAWLVVCNLVLRQVGATRLHDLLGEGFYNGFVAGAGVFPCLALMVATLAADAAITVGTMVSRPHPLRRRRIVAVGVCAAALGGVALIASRSLDPLADYAMLPFVHERTEYAAGYSSDAFASITPGTPWSEVVARLGPPLDAGELNGVYVVRYARGIAGSSFWERVFVLDRQGGVVLSRGVGLYVS